MSPDSRQASFRRTRLSAGTRLNGIYEIDRLIGVGGMGEIYAGHVIETGDAVAVKVMLPELAENAAALTLFRKEASALHHLHHDAIVRYYVFTVEPVLQRPYLAMEFVDGRSLSEMLHIDGPLSFEAVASLMRRLASGLQVAHERGIIHRDVSPDNIIIPGGDVARAKIIDFGIARSTQHGTVIGSGFAGKFNYVSPEQLGMFGADVTGRSDVYSLGLVLVHALTGQPIDMGGSQVDIIEKRRKIPELGAIDMRFRPLLENMLQPDPAGRPDSMAAVAAWPLGGAAPSRQTGTRRAAAASLDPAAAARRRRRWIYAVSALALMALIGGTGAYYYYFSGPEPVLVAKPGRPKLDATTGPTPIPGPAVIVPTGEVDRIKRYVDQYDGGDCFFVSAIAISSSAAALEGFGASTKPFTALDDDFHRTLGFEPDIGVRQVTEAQCPAVGFLGRVRRDAARAPHLDIDKNSLRGGETLTGMVDRFGDRNIELILVSDGGVVQNMSHLLKSGTDARTFSIAMPREGAAGRQPQLLMALASARPLDALRPARAVAAAAYFANVLGEAARTNQPLAATAKYVMVER